MCSKKGERMNPFFSFLSSIFGAVGGFFDELFLLIRGGMNAGETVILILFFSAIAWLIYIITCFIRHKINSRSLTISIIWVAVIAFIFRFTNDLTEGHRWFPYGVGDSLVRLMNLFTVGERFAFSDLAKGELMFNMEALLAAFLNVVPPILTASTILSYFLRFWNQFRLVLPRKKRVYIFSELNEHSLELASSLAEQKKSEQGKYIFCKVNLRNTKNDDASLNSLIDRAKELSAMFVKNRADEYAWNYRGKMSFLLMDKNEPDNSLLAMHLADNIVKGIDFHPKNIKKADIHLYIFSVEESAESVFDQLSRRQVYGDPEDNQAYYHVHLVNESQILSQTLLERHPLITPKRKDEDISLLVVGCGSRGFETLKEMMVCSVLGKGRTKIRVLDKDAGKIEAAFLHRCPALADENSYPAYLFDLKFVACDFTDIQFDSVLEEECQDTTYIIVNTGDDERSITTAMYIGRWYMRRAIEIGCGDFAADLSLVPPRIFVQVDDARIAETFRSLRYETVPIVVFGNDRIYDARTIFSRELDSSADLFDFFYANRELLHDYFLKGESEDTETIEVLHNLIRSGNYEEVRKITEKRANAGTSVLRYSSQMSALHGTYKLASLDKLPYLSVSRLHTRMLKAHENETQEAFESTFCSQYARAVTQIRQNLQNLIETEHDRWSVFSALQGFQKMSQQSILGFTSFLENSPEFAKLGQDKSEKISSDTIFTNRKVAKAKLHGALTENYTSILDPSNMFYQDYYFSDMLFVWLALVRVRMELIDKCPFELSDECLHILENAGEKIWENMKEIGANMPKSEKE